MEVNADSTSLDALLSRDLFKDPDFGSSDTLNNVVSSLWNSWTMQDLVARLNCKIPISTFQKIWATQLVVLQEFDHWLVKHDALKSTDQAS